MFERDISREILYKSRLLYFAGRKTMSNNSARRKRRRRHRWHNRRRKTWRRKPKWNPQQWQTECCRLQKRWSEWWTKTFSTIYRKVGFWSFLPWNLSVKYISLQLLLDYRYWDDPSDEFKEGEGSLLPLWKFSYEKAKKHDITDMCFNSRYYDLFAIAFGSRQ